MVGPKGEHTPLLKSTHVVDLAASRISPTQDLLELISHFPPSQLNAAHAKLG